MHSRILTSIVLLAILSSCYVPRRGYLESSFNLVLESRLPKFIDPDGRKNPAGYKATVDYYSSPNSVRFRIWDPAGKKIFDKHGQFWWHPKGWQPGQGKPETYPSYNGVFVDGVVDILEQRKPEPILYLTDDKQVWESIGEPPTATEAPPLSGYYVPGRTYLESSFNLVLESRLPKFVDPDGHKNPAGYKATVDYYSSPSSVRFRIWDAAGKKIFDKQGQFWWHPKGWQPGRREPTVYPNYVVISFDGVIDILEQRKPEQILYLTDDAELWRTATPGT